MVSCSIIPELIVHWKTNDIVLSLGYLTFMISSSMHFLQISLFHFTEHETSESLKSIKISESNIWHIPDIWPANTPTFTHEPWNMYIPTYTQYKHTKTQTRNNLGQLCKEFYVWKVKNRICNSDTTYIYAFIEGVAKEPTHIYRCPVCSN